MSEERRNVSLGFTNELYPEGTHICYLYNDGEERRHVMPSFVRYGLKDQESVTYAADVASDDELQQVLEYLKIKVNGDTANGQFEIEYEARINNLVDEVPLTVMCQYDARKFDGSTIFDVISVHPIMMIRDHIIRNPFYIPPEQLRAGQNAASRHE